MFGMFASFSIDRGPFSRDLRAMRSEAQAFTDGLERDVQRRSGRAFGGLGDGIKSGFSAGRTAADSFWSAIERGASKATGIFGGLRSAASSIFQGIGQGVGQGVFGLIQQGASGVKGAMLGLNNEMEQASAKINAFTKDGAKTAEILEMVTQRAAKTPFAFAEMANAAGSLIPVGKQAKIGLEELMQTAEILAASNPMEGLEGASFSLREAMTGDFASIIERFNLSRSSINKWKDEGLSNFEIVQRAMKEMGYDADLVAAMGETMSGRWSTFRDTIDSFLRTLTKPGFNILKGWLQSAQTLLDANMPRITQFADLIGNKLANGALAAGQRLLTFGRGVASAFSALTGAFSALRGGQITLAQFVGGVETMVTTVGGKLGELVNVAKPKVAQFVSGVVEGAKALAPQVGAQAGVWAGALTGWITETAIPFLAPKLGAFFSALGTWVSGTGLPWLSRSVVGLATALTGWIGDTAIPYLQQNLPLWGQALVTWITGTYIPTLRSFYGPMATALGGWITGTAIPFLQTNLPLWGAAIGTWLRDTAVPIVTREASALGAAFGGWIGGTAIPYLQANLPRWLAAARDWITQTAVPAVAEAAKALGASVGSWIVTDAIPFLQANLPIWRDTVVTFLRDDALPMAAAAAKGVAAGLTNWITTDAVPGLQANLPKWREAVTDFIRDDAIPMIAAAAKGIGAAILEWDKQAAPEWKTSWEDKYDVANEQMVRTEVRAGVFSNTAAEQIGKWIDTAGPKWLHDWGELKRVATDSENNILNDAAAWTANLGTKVGEWADTAGPKWLHDWGELKRVATDSENNIFNDAAAWTSNLGSKVGEWMNTAGPAWLHDWGELWRVSDQKATDIANRMNRFSDDMGKVFNSIGPAWLHDWGEAGRALSSQVTKAANSAIRSINDFGLKINQAVSGIAKTLGFEASFTFRPVPEIGGGQAPATPNAVGELATGTRNWGGGWAWVGDGNGGSGAELAYLPAGAKVIPHEQSMQLVKAGAVPMFGRDSARVPQFAEGLNFSEIFKTLTSGPAALMEMAIKAIGLTPPQLPGILAGAGTAFFDTVKGWITGWLTEFVKKALPVGPAQVQKMIAFAESQVGLPYIWGGGHGGGLGGPGVGFDCSGFVAAVLNAGGIANPGGIVTTFYEWMAKNGGNGIVDIGIDNPYAAPDVQHMGIRLMGTDYEAGGLSGGVGKHGTRFSQYGTPPNFNPGKAAAPGSLDGVDVERSLRNMRRGVRGQWGALAFAEGGVIDEPLRGIGIDSGIQYLIGEAGRELIIPEKVMPAIASYFQAAFLAGRADVPELRAVPFTLRAAVRRIMERFLAQRGGRAQSGGPGGRGRGGAEPTLGLGLPAAPVIIPPASAAPAPATANDDAPARAGDETGAPARASEWMVAVREGINSSFLFAVFGGGRAAPAPDPATATPGAPGEPEGAVLGGAGLPSPRPLGDFAPGPRGMESPRFPEPVRPYPRRPGLWVGVDTGTVYDSDGNPLQGGNDPRLGLDLPTAPVARPAAPAGWGGAPPYRDGGPTEFASAGGAGTLTLRVDPIEVRSIIALPDGQEIVKTVLVNPTATAAMAEGVFGHARALRPEA